MKRILWIVSAIVLIFAVAAFAYGLLFQDTEMKASGFVEVKGGDYYGKEEVVSGGLPLKAEASCQVSGYSARFAVDNDVETYWEGVGDYPQTIDLSMEKEYELEKLILCLNPIEVWGKRTMTLSIEAFDGSRFIPLVAAADYVFDYTIGNRVEISLPKDTITKIIRITYLANGNVGGGQLAEAVLVEKK